MKTIARYLLVAAALGVVGLFSGCATPEMARAGRATATFQMKVVESSSGRQLSPEEMKTLHDATIRFLAQQGESLLGGTYYVRVNFVPIRPGEPGEWVLVQIISQPIDDYTRVAAYLDSSPYYYPGYASSGSSSYYQDYYYDPYENYSGGGYYHPVPVISPQGHRPHDRDDGNRPHDRDRGDHPPGTYAGGNKHNHDHDRDHNPRTSDNTPRAHDSDRGRNHGSSNSNYEPATASTSSSTRSSGSSGNNSYSPPPTSSYSPPPASAPSEPAPHHESGTPVREDRTSVPTNER